MQPGNADDTWDDAPNSTGITRPVGLPPPRDRGFDDAMHAREVAAMRGFVTLVLALTACVVVGSPLLDLDRVQWITIGLGVVICTAGALRTLPRLRRGICTAADVAITGLTSMIGGSLAIYAFGFFSPAPLVTIMGVFFYGLQRQRRVAIAIFVGTCAIHAAVMGSETFGWIRDHGVIAADRVPVLHRLVAIALVEVVFVLTFLLARAVQNAIVAAARKLESSTRALAQRQALLDEARRELERVLEVGGPGRFTEQRLGCWNLGVLCGRGAMGDVYAANHVETGMRAAVKLLTRDSARDPESVRRFLREARIAASIDVPNVVRVLEVGQDDAPVPFIAMELLEGRDLASILRAEKRLAMDELIEMLAPIARGLDAAHTVGVVHRDLKPQNLFRADTDDGHVWKILDFGVSRLIDVDSSLTRGQAIGTPSYMSPEQARGHEVDHRADIFALGVLAYRCLVGRPAFAGSEVPEILYRVVYAMPPRPSALIDVPRAVDDVIAIALAKRPQDRFASAGEMVAVLAAAGAGHLPGELHLRARRLTADLPWGREDKTASAAWLSDASASSVTVLPNRTP